MVQGARVPLTVRDGTLVPGVVAGLLFAFEFTLIYVALDFTTVARGIVLIYFAPVVVAVGAHFLIPRERLTAIRLIGLVAAFAGVVIAFSDKLSLPNSRALVGDVLCLIAAFRLGGDDAGHQDEPAQPRAGGKGASLPTRASRLRSCS